MFPCLENSILYGIKSVNFVLFCLGFLRYLNTYRARNIVFELLTWHKNLRDRFLLTLFWPVFPFYTPWKQKPNQFTGFFMRPTLAFKGLKSPVSSRFFNVDFEQASTMWVHLCDSVFPKYVACIQSQP